MSRPLNRRQFVQRTLTTGALASLAELSFLKGLPSVSADEASVSPATVRFSPEIEPLVRLLEDTPRDKLLDTLVERIHDEETTYQKLLSAVFLAGVRGIMPRPVGFQFHAVLVINSAHLAALDSTGKQRWLPLLWAADNFKASQARHHKEHDGWMLPPADEAKLLTAPQAHKRFTEAMDNWHEEGADGAVTSLVRSTGAGEMLEVFLRYGARDFRDIGHKAIYVANSWRTLQTIGWRHAEPVVRSLAFALLQHEGGNPAQRDDERDRPARENLQRLTKIRSDWQTGKAAPEAATEMLAVLRSGEPGECSARVVELLNKGIDPASVWDGLFLAADELLMRQPGIIGVHCVTSTNALHYGYQASGNDETRRLMMLQAAAFLAMFRKFMAGNGKLPEGPRIDTLEAGEVKAKGPDALEEIFTELSKDRLSAARKALAWLGDDRHQAEELMALARDLIFSKGNDSHDYKFSSAALEDFYHATPAWRQRYLAGSLFHLRGLGDQDNGLIQRARAALAQG